MSAESGFTRAWRVGAYTATLSCPPAKPGAAHSACIEWDPHMPPRMTAAEVEQYRAGRNAAIADLAAELGVTVGVLEL